LYNRKKTKIETISVTKMILSTILVLSIRIEVAVFHSILEQKSKRIRVYDMPKIKET